MRAYALRRLLLLVPTLIGISLLAFGLIKLAPGDAAAEFLRRTTDRPPTGQEIEQVRRELGLDRPFAVQYARWLERAVQGDLGVSYSTRQPVVTEFRRRVPFTLELAIPAALLAIAIALPAGLISALRPNRPVDHAMRLLSLAGASMPGFWLALLLIIVFAVRLSLVPVAGRGGPASLVLPVVTLAVTPAATLSRFTRSTMLETLGEDYIRTARAKGVPAWSILFRHALRNALIPIVTVFGTNVGHLLAGASGLAVIETIFVWPGLGKLAVDAISQRDYPMIQAFVLFAGATFVLINLVVDLSYAVIDPRVRLDRGPGMPR
jgi:peptide/nickel transport system permease protein